MKTFTSAAMAEIAAGTAIEVGAVEILSDPPLRVWGGPWPMTMDGVEYLGVGDRGMVRQSSAGLGSTAQGVTLELSGVDPDNLRLLDADEIKGAPVILRRLIYNGAGTMLLDVHVFQRGRIDLVTTEETPAGPAIIRVMIEGAARGLRRRGGRMRTDADQRLVAATDGGMKHVAYAAQKTLYWGGHPPSTAATALSGSTSWGGAGNALLARVNAV